MWRETTKHERNMKIFREEIDRFNATARVIASARGVCFVDVTDLSREAEDNPALIARDGLHFSGEMYRLWVGRMLPDIRAALGLR